ncbi:hypothetical protein [Aestuariimicrobium sp. Y1814]|uniref:hypothetical protein n=1 Tax=Aestuariimicrobium sp. Y1814 TaxID=3418742 RepID=UPI003DA79825
MDIDPVESNPDLYHVVFENERVRVLEYRDTPGTVSRPHHHPDSVMVTLSSFDRRLVSGERHVEVSLGAGTPVWLPAQTHHGENIGTTPTHVMLVELKEPAPRSAGQPAGGAADTGQPLGPEVGVED